MRHKILIIVIYFGEWPAYWPLFFESVRRNPSIDFSVWGDRIPVAPALANVKCYSSTLEEMQRRFSSTLATEVYLSRPYKLCDLKPMYGAAFEEHTQGYDFWGYSDIDMVFGDLRKFLSDSVLDGHQKFFSRGHLTLYKNDQASRDLFRGSGADLNWRSVVADPRSHAFDEWKGIHKIALSKGVPTYLEEVILDVDPQRRRLQRTRGQSAKPQTMFYHYGKVFMHQYPSEPEEFAYIHLQKRPLRFEEKQIDPKAYYYFMPDRVESRNEIATSCLEMEDLNPTRVLGEAVWKAKVLKRRLLSASRKLREGWSGWV